MKKSLLAVAAMTAFAGAAQAQSSVTVYGILDVGFISQSTRTSGPTPAASSKAITNQFGTSAETTSRLGFKGVEDLGGGTTAFFTVETGLQPTSAAGASTWNNRQSFVGLGKKGIGQAAIGTQYTPIHTAVAVTDPGGQNNMIGNVIYPTNTVTGLGNAGTAPIGISSNGGGGQTDAYTIRTANTISATSDTFAGFQGRVFYTLAATDSSQTQTTAAGVTTNTGGSNNYSGYGLGVNYTWNKLLVTANYQSLKQELSAVATTNATGATTPSAQIWSNAGAGGAAATLAQNIQDNQAYIAGTYDFGILKAYAQWINRKATATYNSNIYAKRSAQQIGVRSFITPKIEGWASIGNGRLSSFGNTNPTANFNAWQLGSNYYLSKRTNLYAIYGQSQTSNVTYVNGANTISAGGSNYAVGVRHTF